MLQDVALLTDGRFSGGSHGFVVGHICPEAQVSLTMLCNHFSIAIIDLKYSDASYVNRNL